LTCEFAPPTVESSKRRRDEVVWRWVEAGGKGFGRRGPFKCDLIARVPLGRTGAVAATVAIGSALPDVPLPHDVDLDLEDECVRVACLGVL
jgi:hypothetical protein